MNVNSGATNISAIFESTDGVGGIQLKDNSGNVELTTTAGNFEVRPAGGSPTAVFSANGFVGIGTSSPDYSFVVQGDNNINDNIFAVKDSDGTRMMSVEQTSNGDGRIITFDTSGVAKVLLHTNGTSYFNGGNVAFGSTSSTNLLTINANTGSTPTVYINNGSPNATEGLALKVQASGRGSGIADVSIFSVHNNANELFTVRNDGNVGIGTTSPSQLLSVKGTVALEATNSTNAWLAYTYTDNSLRFNLNGAGADEIVIDSSGNVGIGTTSPAVNLHVNSASDTYLLMSTSNATADNRILFRNSAGTDAGGLWYATNNNSMQFRTNSAERMRIDSNGNIGIGTSSTSTSHRVTIEGLGGDRTQPLEVLGTGSTQNFNWLISGMQQNLSAGQRAVLFLGKSESTYNSGGMYYYHAGDGSASNELRWGLFAADDLMRLSTSGNLDITGNLTVADRTVFRTAGFHDNATNGNNGGVTIAGGPALIPTNGSGSATNASVSLGSSAYQFNQLHLDGDTYRDGNPTGHIFKRYYAASGITGNANDWYPIGRLSDASSTPAYFSVRAYAHTSVTFIVSMGYTGAGVNAPTITILNTAQNHNGAYIAVRRARISNANGFGTVEVQLYWTSGPGGHVEVHAWGTGTNLEMPTSLTASSGATAYYTTPDWYGNTGQMSTNGSLLVGGRITAENQPYFYALSTDVNVDYFTAGTVLNFNIAQEQQGGSNYSTTNKRFTAPVTGIYSFTCMIYGNDGGSNHGFAFHKNGSRRVSGMVRDGSGDGYAPAAMIIKLDANDYVDIRSVGVGVSNFYGGSSYTYSQFSGVLIG